MAVDIKSSNQRAVIMDLVKMKFGNFAFWKRIEHKVALICANIPEPSDEEKKQKLILGLGELKEFLINEQVDKIDLVFLDEEIERFTKTKQISLYEEQEDELPAEIIDKYSRLGFSNEGIVGIHLNLNYEQLKRLTNGVYNKTGLIKFYISREKTLYGKIVAEIYEHPQKIPIATLVQSKKLNETGEPKFKRISLFGEKINLKEVSKIKEIEVPFRVYRFITEYNQDLILLTPEQMNIGDYIVTGVTTQVDDYKILTDTAKLPTKLPYIFAQQIRNRIIKYKDHEEFREKIRLLGINKTKAFDFPFTLDMNDKLYVLKHPEWFKWLLWSWLIHKPKGMFNRYPMHLMIVGPPTSGKSMLLNCLHKRSKENRPIFSGSSSTLKNLVPSFKNNPARLGYLAESNRFAFCDEFLRCLTRGGGKSSGDGSAKDESVSIMNDLLEHQKREAGSGISRVNVNMTSKIIATTNPVRDIHCVEDLLKNFDGSFLSRWLIYFQEENGEHVRMIREAKQKDLVEHDFSISENDWISIIDYLQTFDAEFDDAEVEKIYTSVFEVFSPNMRNHYNTRHRHHIHCLIDGIVKARCLFERDISFKAKSPDYEWLSKIWHTIIKSWINVDMVRHLPQKNKIHYLPENCQYLYWKIAEQKRPLTRLETEILALKEMTKREYIDAYVLLKDHNLITEENEYVGINDSD